MTDVSTIVREDTRLSSGDSDTEHYYCSCDPDTALCGLDLTGLDDHTYLDTPPEDDCVVCVDLIEVPCRRCGKVNDDE